MLCKVELIGNLGNEPTFKKLENGEYCYFSVATNEQMGTKNHTEWHKVVVWGKLANVCSRYLKKGMLVFVSGTLKTRSYESNGETFKVTEVVGRVVKFLSPKNNNRDNNISFEEEMNDFNSSEEYFEDNLPF